MDPKTYVEGVLVNEVKDFEAVVDRFTESNIRLLHAAMGAATEAGEFVDAIKKHIFYGKKLDKTNLVEELGDLFWYIGIASDVLGISFEEIMTINHNKLFTRYQKGFSEKEANNRNLDTERKVLSGWHKVDGGMVGVNVGADEKEK